LKIVVFRAFNLLTPKPNDLIAYIPYFKKISIGFCDHRAFCVSVYPPYQLLNGWFIKNLVCTDVSEEHIASIFRVEEIIQQE
jgi:hypothetical protein